jgi:hypothetical protein
MQGARLGLRGVGCRVQDAERRVVGCRVRELGCQI